MSKNTVSLKEHILALRKADLRAVKVALDRVARQRAEDQHRDELYRESQNEWRNESKDRAGTYMTIAAFEQYQRNQSGDRFNGRIDLRGIVTILIAVAALVITLLKP